MPKHTLLTMLLGTTLLASAHGGGALADDRMNKNGDFIYNCDLAVTSVSASVDGVAVLNNGTVKNSSNLTVKCTIKETCDNVDTHYIVTLSSTGQSPQTVYGSFPKANGTGEVTFKPFKVMSPPGTSTTITCQIALDGPSPYSVSTAHENKNQLADNTMSMTLKVTK